MAEPQTWIAALRNSQDRLANLVAGLSDELLRAKSYDDEWSVAQVLSHLGSQAEIFSLLLDAGLSGGEPPGPDVFGPIWDSWNARSPAQQAADSIAANEGLVRRLEGLDADQVAAFHLAAFGRALDLADLARMRLSEHAVHVWDVAVTIDPEAGVAPDAVALLVDHLGDTASRAAKPRPRPATLAVATSEPERRFALVTDGVRLEPWADQSSTGSLELPAEALVRLVYGRLDPAHSAGVRIDAGDMSLDDLRAVFPGF